MSNDNEEKADEKIVKEPETWGEDEESPDGLKGTPSERFTEAAKRIFSVSKDDVEKVKGKGEEEMAK